MMPDRKARVLIVEDDEFLRRQIASYFGGRYEIHQASDRQEALAQVRGGDVDLVLLDMRLPPHTDSIEEGLRTVSEIFAAAPGTLTIAMSGDGDRQTILSAAAAGVYDFFTKPLDINELEVIIRRALDRRHLESEIRRLREQLQEKYDFRNMRGNSPAMQAVKGTIRKVADSNATIMILGESGTGKELVARAIHFNSSRREGPFVALNCSAFPEHLVEDELFGHEKGAFTGAVGRREGRFEMADGGTLFLDELGTLSAAIQAKLLRVIESREFERLGGKETVRVDIRLVTATNSDIMREVDEGRFRQDLFYRLNVVAIRLPPLRDRREDIPLLADHFLDRFCRENARPRKRLAADALEAVTAHEWKGNVRELEHAMESLVLLTDRDLITAGDLPVAIRSGVPAAPDTRPDVQAGPAPGASDPEPLPEAGIVLERQVAAFERNLLLSALHKSEGRRKEAAALLGLNKDQMKYLCRKYGL